MNTKKSSHILKHLLFLLLIIGFSVFYAERGTQRIGSSSELIVAAFPCSDYQKAPRGSLGYENIKVPVSNFSDLSFITLSEADSRLDELDPRRTVFIRSLIGFFKPDPTGYAKYLFVNNSSNRKYVLKEDIDILNRDARGDSFIENMDPDAVRILFVLLFIIPLVIQRKKPGIAVAVQTIPWIVQLVFSRANMEFYLIGLGCFYNGLFFILEGRRGDIPEKWLFLYIILSSSLLALSAYLIIGSSLSALFFLAAAAYPVFALKAEMFAMEKINKRHIHAIYSPVKILSAGFDRRKGSPVFYAVLIIITLSVSALNYASSFHADEPELREMSPGLTIDDYYRNAAFQYGYLFNYGYKEPDKKGGVVLTQFKENNEGVRKASVIVKEFTDDWYKDIIAKTQPLLLAFLNSGDTGDSGKSGSGSVILLPLFLFPVSLIAMRRYLHRINMRTNGLSCIMRNP